MAEVLLSNRYLTTPQMTVQCDVPVDLLNENQEITGLLANRPYLLGQELSSIDYSIHNILSSAPDLQNLTELSLSLGDNNTIAISDMMSSLSNVHVGLMGTSTAMYSNRMAKFAEAVNNYQNALMRYRKTIEGRASSAVQKLAKQSAHQAFQKMQFNFRHELAVVSGNIKSRRGTPLSNPSRAINIARSSRNVSKLNVTSQVQAHNLVKLNQYGKYLGNGIALVDFGSRIGNVRTSYQSGGDWERDMFIESSSFALSAAAGASVVNAGSTVLGFLMIATPVGWVGLIIGGAAVISIAATSSIALNNYTKKNSGEWYDKLLKLINS